MNFRKLKTRFLNYLVLILTISCGNAELKQMSDESYYSSGVEQFFLAELPLWANFSVLGQCEKSSSIQYLNFSKLKINYELGYSEMVELQAQFNFKRESYFSHASQKFLKPVEEVSFFTNSLEQVKSGVKLVKLPKTSQINIIWLENFLKNHKIEELAPILERDQFLEYPTILFSSCLTRWRMEEWLKEKKAHSEDVHFIGAEWLTPYDPNNELGPGLFVHLNKLIGEAKFLIFEIDNYNGPLELKF